MLIMQKRCGTDTQMLRKNADSDPWFTFSVSWRSRLEKHVGVLMGGVCRGGTPHSLIAVPSGSSQVRGPDWS